MMKKTLGMILAGAMLMTALAGCGGSGDGYGNGGAGTQEPAQTDSGAGTAAAMEGSITVISREEGSGTRGAFVELTGVEEKDADGNKADNTTPDAQIANKTDVVLTSVSGDPAAIGYISLGSLNNTVKALTVDGVEATTDNVKSGAYTLARPFNIATKGEPAGVAKDFIAFILSAEGQQVIVDNKYIAVDDGAAAFTSDGSSGTISVGGSSSVYPVMEKLVEAYKAANPNATVELQSSDSTAGMTGAMDGTFDIGMASRELKDSESAELTGTAIALDGIAVIVNPENTLDGVTADQIKGIYTGEITDWADVAA
ncbi:substrate-binding domain-containing protein [Intestinibacillus massiliensis]|nr:substrate-binding domain-containing protein [Intestinibacillus massiliensis]